MSRCLDVSVIAVVRRGPEKNPRSDLLATSDVATAQYAPRCVGLHLFYGIANGRMDESGIDMGFDLAALTADLEHREASLRDYRCFNKANGVAVGQSDNVNEIETETEIENGNGNGNGNGTGTGTETDQHDWEQALSFLSSPLQDIMYYELKSRTPNTTRYVIGCVEKHLRYLNPDDLRRCMCICIRTTLSYNRAYP